MSWLFEDAFSEQVYTINWGPNKMPVTRLCHNTVPQRYSTTAPLFYTCSQQPVLWGRLSRLTPFHPPPLEGFPYLQEEYSFDLRYHTNINLDTNRTQWPLKHSFTIWESRQFLASELALKSNWFRNTLPVISSSNTNISFIYCSAMDTLS